MKKEKKQLYKTKLTRLIEKTNINIIDLDSEVNYISSNSDKFISDKIADIDYRLNRREFTHKDEHSIYASLINRKKELLENKNNIIIQEIEHIKKHKKCMST